MLNILRKRNAKNLQQLEEKRQAAESAAKYMLRTPELVHDSCLERFPNKLPVGECNLSRLQGQQDVILYLSNLIKTANGDID